MASAPILATILRAIRSGPRFLGLGKTEIPLMLTAAELDPEGFVQQLELGKQATCKRTNGCARSYMLPQHSHMSEVYAINTGDTRLTDEILEFVKVGK